MPKLSSRKSKANLTEPGTAASAKREALGSLGLGLGLTFGSTSAPERALARARGLSTAPVPNSSSAPSAQRARESLLTEFKAGNRTTKTPPIPVPRETSSSETSSSETATEPALESKLDFDLFPPLKGALRVIYFETLTEWDRTHLQGRGYRPTCLMEVSRETDAGHQEYLLALAQGMAEGTIPVSRQRLQACELEMKARKMLLQRDAPVHKTKQTKSTEELLDNFGKTRHGFKQTTMMSSLLGED